jgi:hypothetical protein
MAGVKRKLLRSLTLHVVDDILLGVLRNKIMSEKAQHKKHWLAYFNASHFLLKMKEGMLFCLDTFLEKNDRGIFCLRQIFDFGIL